MQLGSQDPRVVSMKQTLYRTSSDSPMFHALTEAAQTKEVTVVVELMARFDEASNIRWARNLEDAGVQVFHGIVGLKTHCKLAMLIRRDPDGVTRRYAHLGTGNYNPNTARFYTDISLLTADPEITASVHSVFNYLTAHSESDDYAPLLVAPLTLAESTIRMIHREAEHAAAGRPAHIIAKMNSLLEQAVIEALYAASKAGVQIDLIVRGICSLRPGIPGSARTFACARWLAVSSSTAASFISPTAARMRSIAAAPTGCRATSLSAARLSSPSAMRKFAIASATKSWPPIWPTRPSPAWRRLPASYPRVRAPEGKSFSAQDFFIRVAEGRDSIDSIPEPAWEPETMATEPEPGVRSPGQAAAPQSRPQARRARRVLSWPGRQAIKRPGTRCSAGIGGIPYLPRSKLKLGPPSLQSR